ncbi:MAG: phosphate acyltransferase, partial [Intestinibacter sp.]
MKIEDIIRLTKEREPKTVSVACCQDREVLIAVENARKEGIINGILIGDIDKTRDIASELNINLDNYELINIKDLGDASLKAVELVSSKKADI